MNLSCLSGAQRVQFFTAMLHTIRLCAADPGSANATRGQESEYQTCRGNMKVYSYSQARQKLTEVLNRSRSEPVVIRRRGGEAFRVSPQQPQGSPLDVRGVRTGATTSDIVRTIRESRRGTGRRGVTGDRGQTQH